MGSWALNYMYLWTKKSDTQLALITDMKAGKQIVFLDFILNYTNTETGELK